MYTDTERKAAKRESQRRYRLKNQDKLRAAHMIYYQNNKEWIAQKAKIYLKTPAGKAVVQRRLQKFPLKHKARWLVVNAIKYGRIRRGHCEWCGTDIDVQAHHEDYKQPFDIIWLCRKHHTELHVGVRRRDGT